jgi:hypothetical protein
MKTIKLVCSKRIIKKIYNKILKVLLQINKINTFSIKKKTALTFLIKIKKIFIKQT